MSTSFDSALDYLQWLRIDSDFKFSPLINPLIVDVKLLKTLFPYARQAKSNNKNKNREMLGCILFRIKDFVSRITNDIHSAYLSSGKDDALIEVSRCREDIKRFGMEIKQLCISLLDDHYYSLGGHHQQLVDLFLSLSGCLTGIWFYNLEMKGTSSDEIEDLHGKLLCSRDFIVDLIGFATMQCVDQVQLADLLIHVEVLAVNAACLIQAIWYDRDNNDAEEHNKNKFVQTSQLLQKMKPVHADLQFREAYIHVLAVSKLSRPSTHIFSPEKDDGLMVATKFMDSLLGDLAELQQSYTSIFFSVHDGMYKLHEGVRFLCILVREQHEKFAALDDELKDLIGVVIIDAGIFIWSISLNELKEGFTKEIDVTLSHLLEVLKFIMAEAAHIYSPTSSAFSFPTTNELGSIDFLLENLKELTSCDCETNSVALLKDQICIVQEGLQSLRSFLENIAGQRNQNMKLQTLWNRVMEVAHKAEFVIDSIMVGDKPCCSPMSLDNITKEIKFLEAEALEICDSVRHANTQALNRVTKTPSIHMPSQISPLALNNVLVGLDEEVRTIIDGLTRGSKQLDIVSIVGMPGLGKTTLANEVYNDSLIAFHFHIRAWCSVSQGYSKHNLLLQILGNITFKKHDEYLKMSEDDLAEFLYKRLKGNRYLIVLDDVWDIEALNLLKGSFPNDENASRILFTSRRHDLCPGSKPHCLPLLTDAESWKLLQNKIFGKECCPPKLSVVGMQIAEGCRGLPLAVVVVAGVLANIDQSCWEEVANSLSSSAVIGIEHCMETLELSYRWLPDYLKSCLLYFGAFREDQDIPVRRLLWLWISEGFVQNNKAMSLEQVANECLMDLIDRSLVMAVQQRSIGGVKVCRVHDLLREFCVAKAKEESFLQIVHGYNQLFTSNRPYNLHKLCICYESGEEVENPRLYFPHLRSLLLFSGSGWVYHNYSFIFRIFKLLRVLDIRKIYRVGETFPGEVELLVHLRYLAIECESSSIPYGIANLSRLETFIIAGHAGAVTLPDTIWNMKKLRHLWCLNGFIFPTDDLEVSPDLYHLETCILYTGSSSAESLQKIIKKFPSIRRLKIHGFNKNDGTIVLDYLDRLESLQTRELSPTEICFPLNLKKLTLSFNEMPWSEISTIGKLPNLEVLKLLDNSFVGEIWEMEEEEFPRLRFLKLKHLNLRRWIASCDNFPCLEKLVLYYCQMLEDVPPSLGEIPTLEMIEVKSCRKSTTNSVEKIQEEQKDMGNDSLKIVIH